MSVGRRCRVIKMMPDKGESNGAQRLVHRRAGSPCMHTDRAQTCLNQDDFLSSPLPFVCCFVSVLCRHHGLDPSNTRYSKCMNLSTPTIYLSWQAGLIRFRLDADQNLRSKVEEGSFSEAEKENLFFFLGGGGWFWLMFSVWAHVSAECSQIVSHHILWKGEKYHSAVSIIRAECTVQKDTLDTLKGCLVETKRKFWSVPVISPSQTRDATLSFTGLHLEESDLLLYFYSLFDSLNCFICCFIFSTRKLCTWGGFFLLFLGTFVF